jgi:hypothetical protein
VTSPGGAPAAPGIADADALALALTHLREHPRVLGVLGDNPERIGSRNRPPYPCVRLIETPGGSDRDGRWLLAPEVQFEVYGDLDESRGSADLRRIAYIVLGALLEMPDRTARPGEAVATHVQPSGKIALIPEPTGQKRYVGSVLVAIHPPQS